MWNNFQETCQKRDAIVVDGCAVVVGGGFGNGQPPAGQAIQREAATSIHGEGRGSSFERVNREVLTPVLAPTDQQFKAEGGLD